MAPAAPAEAGGTAAAATNAPPVPGSARDAHPDPDNAIVVTAVRRNGNDLLGGVSVLDQQALTRDARPSIGETLAKQPGVSASSFGPTASRPILRGLSGDRIRLLTDGIGSLDLSDAGPDHAVAINPLTAERIEVLRGPTALLYGSSAIGGVVNVIDNRIPRRVPPNGVADNALAELGSAARERSVNTGVDVGLGAHWVAHVDGNYAKFDDLRIGGYVLSDPLRAEAAASTDPAIRALADLKGRLPNTAGRTDGAAAGLAYVDGGLNIGGSVSTYNSRYGVPVRYSLDPGGESEQPTIDAHQRRADVRATVPLGGFFQSFNLRGGIGRYHHDELNAQGQVGTSFYSNGGEIRADLAQTERGGWGGTTGVQYLEKSARIRGDEKFLPDSRQKQLGLFTLQTFASGPVRIEGGARIESSSLSADADPQIGTPDLSRSFTTVSGSLGASYEVVPGWRAGVSLARSERAPAVEELFANGPHGGSETFERGDPNLRTERSLSGELTLRHTTGPVHVEANLYYSRFSSFIYQTPTGETLDDLPVYAFQQGKARYYGFELQGDARLGHALGIDWGGELVSDAVRATISGFGPAPFIPPFRVLGALTGSRGPFDGRLEVERTSAQNRTAPNETRTAGFTMVNASLDWHPFKANPALTLSLQGNNLFDVDARRATSLLKDYAPLAGRDIRLTARLGF
ncbi:TonB-dependent receptor [Sphingomonas ginkgonis]|nr:TonB-dependent receptor [Sphingomonas ginkgonis]